MEQGPSWDTNGSSASQEIPCILWNLKEKVKAKAIPLQALRAPGGWGFQNF
jgi:hypothetical protein